MKRNRKKLEMISYIVWFNWILTRNPLFRAVAENLSNEYTLFQDV